MTLSPPWKRDLRAVKRLAAELLEQVEHFERNTAKGSDDRIRAAVFIWPRALNLQRAALRMERRYYRERTRELGLKRGDL